jgi:hypothetical protein
MINCKRYLTIICLFVCLQLRAQKNAVSLIEQTIIKPQAEAKPWVFWYWMNGAVSKLGITADLEAMSEVGIGGAYLMPIKDTSKAIPFEPQVRQLTPQWWTMVKFAMEEAKRLNLKLAMHVSDGFALAGGPWIKPEQSMQKLVWTKTYIQQGFKGNMRLQMPDINNGFYKDIAVYAYPIKKIPETNLPIITTSTNAIT